MPLSMPINTSWLSAICGTHFAETKVVASIVLSPVFDNLLMSFIFTSFIEMKFEIKYRTTKQQADDHRLWRHKPEYKMTKDGSTGIETWNINLRVFLKEKHEIIVKLDENRKTYENIHEFSRIFLIFIKLDDFFKFFFLSKIREFSWTFS